MYETLVAALRNVNEYDSGYAKLMYDAADAIEAQDRHILTLQHEMMAEAESHIAEVNRLNKQVEELQKNVAYWQAQLTKSMCGETLAELEKPRWISVTEQLPELHEEVLVCTEEYGETVLGFAMVAVFDGTGWLETWERKTYLTAVTHWMPLPEPPKEEA